MKWWQEIQEQMSRVPARYLVIGEPVGPGEKVVGKLSEELLRLYGLYEQRHDNLERRVAAHNLGHILPRMFRADCAEFREEVRLEVKQLALLQDLFWAAVRSEIDIPPGSSIGVRADGDVVSFEAEEEEESPLDPDELTVIAIQVG
jgi:hypothetical protein